MESIFQLEYLDENGCRIFVKRIGDKKFAVVRRRENGIEEPVGITAEATFEKAQAALDFEAKKRGWLRASGPSPEEMEAVPQGAPAEIARKISDLRPYLGDRDYDREVFVRETRYFLQMTLEGMLEAGRRLICLKEMEPHGEFVDALKEIGIQHQRAWELMQIAHFAEKHILSKYPESGYLKKFETMGKTRLLLLSKIPDDVLDQYGDSETIAGMDIDEIAATPLDQLRAQVRELKQQVGQGAAQVRQLQQEKDRLKDELADVQGLNSDHSRAENYSTRLFKKLMEALALLGDNNFPADAFLEPESNLHLRKCQDLVYRLQHEWDQRAAQVELPE